MAAIILVGLDEAIVGVASNITQEPVLVYSLEKIKEIFVVRDGMDEDEAEEHIGFNVTGLYAGPGTPMFFTGMTPDEALEHVNEIADNEEPEE